MCQISVKLATHRLAAILNNGHEFGLTTPEFERLMKMYYKLSETSSSACLHKEIEKFKEYHSTAIVLLYHRAQDGAFGEGIITKKVCLLFIAKCNYKTLVFAVAQLKSSILVLSSTCFAKELFEVIAQNFEKVVISTKTYFNLEKYRPYLRQRDKQYVLLFFGEVKVEDVECSCGNSLFSKLFTQCKALFWFSSI